MRIRWQFLSMAAALAGAGAMMAMLALAEAPIIIAGPATVIDGDTLKIDTVKIRLHGIDAPEKKQRCKNYPCGEIATLFLDRLISSDVVTCKGQQYDRYKRLIAICYWQQVDLNALMVSAGLSHAYLRYSKQYIGAQEWAIKNKQGMWNFQHISPEDFRRGKKQ